MKVFKGNNLSHSLNYILFSYAPCNAEKDGCFRVAVVLPRGTNTDKPAFAPVSEEDKWMTARNKWLLAHPESKEAKNGAHVGLAGLNIDIKEDL